MEGRRGMLPVQTFICKSIQGREYTSNTHNEAVQKQSSSPKQTLCPLHSHRMHLHDHIMLPVVDRSWHQQTCWSEYARCHYQVHWRQISQYRAVFFCELSSLRHLQEWKLCARCQQQKVIRWERCERAKCKLGAESYANNTSDCIRVRFAILTHGVHVHHLR